MSADGQPRQQLMGILETFNYLLGLDIHTRRVYDDDGRRYGAIAVRWTVVALLSSGVRPKRLLSGEDMNIAIRRAHYELERLDNECGGRRWQIEERRHVQVHAPALLNVALLLT